MVAGRIGQHSSAVDGYNQVMSSDCLKSSQWA